MAHALFLPALSPPPAASGSKIRTSVAAALDADRVEFAPGERLPVSAIVASEAMMVVAKNLLAPSSRDARFTMSPMTV